MRKILLAMIIVSVILSSGCTDSGTSDTDNSYISSDGSMPDRTDMRRPPTDGNFTRPEMPEFNEPTDTELEEVTSVFNSGDTSEITAYCADNDKLCTYYCMKAGRDNDACQTIIESIRAPMPETEMNSE